jgi:tetratricopeptide (TPR) repeat protein
MPPSRSLLLLSLAVGCPGDMPAPSLEPADMVQAPASGEPIDLQQATRLMERARAESRPELFDEAEALIDAAITADDCDAEAWAARGNLLIERWHYGSQRGTGPDQPSAEALAHFDRALACDPQSWTALRGRAWYHEQLGAFDEVVAFQQLRVDRNPHDEGAYQDLGTALLHAGRFDEAAKALEQVVERRRDRNDRMGLVGALDALGRARLRLGDHSGAEAALQESVRLMQALEAEGQREFVACPYVALGQLYRIEGQDQQGAEMFVAAAEAEPHRPGAWFRAAQALFWVGEAERALPFAEQAVTMDPQQPYVELQVEIEQAIASGTPAGAVNAQAALDAALRAFQRYEFAAAEAWIAQLPADQTPATALVLRGLAALMQARYAQVEALISQVEQQGHDPCDPALVRGHLLIARRDYEGAREVLEPCLGAAEAQLGPAASESVPSGWTWLRYELLELGMAWVHANQARHRQALTHFEAVLRHQPSDRFALIGKANALNASGDLDGAEAALRRVLELDPDNMYATAELGLVALNRGELEEAKASFERAAALEPTSYTCPHEGLGMVYMRMGDTDAAKAAFEQAIAINPDIEFEKYNGLARIHMKAGDYDRAEVLLRKSMENHPQDPTARELLAELERLRAGD